MTSSIECTICGATPRTRFKKSEGFLDSEGLCSDCSSKKKYLTEWRKFLGMTVDEIMLEPDLHEACYKINFRIQAKRELNWPDESCYKISLHELAFLHIHDLIEGLPGEGLDGHLGNRADDFWQILSALKMAGFDEAYNMLCPQQENVFDPYSVDHDVWDAALPKERLINFVRANRDLFK